MKTTILKQTIEDSIAKSDPNIVRGSREFMAASTLLASAHVGPSDEKIAKLMGYPPEIVGMFGDALRRNKIWRGQRVHADWTGEHGAMEFWLGVTVALGWVGVKNK